MNRQQMEYRQKVIANRNKAPVKHKSHKPAPLECVQLGLGVESLFKAGSGRPLFGVGRGLPLH